MFFEGKKSFVIWNWNGHGLDNNKFNLTKKAEANDAVVQQDWKKLRSVYIRLAHILRFCPVHLH